GPLALAAPPSQQEVEEALTCQCGCGLTVHSCNHLQCPSGEPMKADITGRIAKGEDKETILAAYRTKYGEKVLSAPTFVGFNWLAWLTPFVTVTVAAVVLTLAIQRRARTVAAAGTPAPAAPPPSDPLRARLERELAAMDEET